MNDTGRSTGTPERPPNPQEAPGTTRRGERQAARALEELHGPLDAAWKSVSEVARLVDEIHRRRGNRRIR